MDDSAESTDGQSRAIWRYAGRKTGEGTVEIFDTENDDAWIESDVSFDLS
jgi:hypothetical protein